MKVQDFYERFITVLKITLILVAHMLVQLSAAVAQTSAIQFGVEVPCAPEAMQIYKLAPSRPRIVFLNEKLRAAKLPALRLEQNIVRGAIGGDERDWFRALVDPQSGDAHFTPNFAELVRLPASEKTVLAECAASIAGVAGTTFLNFQERL